METLAIVGASLAGLSAARAARAQGFDGRLVIIGDEHHRPYDRPPLSKDFLLGTITAEDLYLESDDDALQAQWLLGGGAVGLDAGTRTIRLPDGQTVTADGIVIATGARARQTMINNGPVPFTAQLGQDMGAVVADLHAVNGVDLICSAAVEEFHIADGKVTGVRLADGRRLDTDVVV
jgi:NADPH-dependent 2,4-dienoyl-CoA reductase/sulfur reductase-like enzyme